MSCQLNDPRLPERIWAKIVLHPLTGCWLWTGALLQPGYGRAGLDGRRWLTHRLVYTALIGEIPAGLTLDHVAARGCLYRNCCNPAHLEPVTLRENIRRSPTSLASIHAAKTHCPQGHPYDEVNTRRQSNGGRECRECDRARHRK